MPREPTFDTRQPQPPDRFKHIVIITEGEKTEPQYFVGVLLGKGEKIEEPQYLFGTVMKLRESRIIVEVVKKKQGDGSSAPQHLVKHSKEIEEKYELQKYDETWIVFDADSWQNQAFEELKNWKNQENNRHLAYSNPCFELWLILHLTEYDTVKNPIESTEIKRRSQLCKKLLGELYRDQKLSGYHNYVTAIPKATERAKVLDVTENEDFPQDICTRVYRLVEKLTNLPKKHAFY